MNDSSEKEILVIRIWMDPLRIEEKKNKRKSPIGGFQTGPANKAILLKKRY